ncbi:hypothetical protein [Micromonospora sp. NPDC005305]
MTSAHLAPRPSSDLPADRNVRPLTGRTMPLFTDRLDVPTYDRSALCPR